MVGDGGTLADMGGDAMGQAPGGIAVVGTLNLDLVVRVERRPDVGETVLGTGYSERPGGKGANQAAAAAGVGPTALVGAVGSDDAGRLLLDAAESAGVDTRFVGRRPGPSGRAVIEVDESGDNRIIVVAGANDELAGGEVVAALDELRPTSVLTQLESPRAVTVAVAGWCRDSGARFVLNPSPVADLDPEIVALADPLVVNEGEAAHYDPGGPVRDGDVEEQARRLLSVARSVVITLGGRGVVVADGRHVDGPRVQHIPVPEVEVVDTTGAGDQFVGTLVASLDRGQTLVEASAASAQAATELVARER
ncbi:ribokinase [Gordonia soli NBRC 108243]|uniref:Ribokinase n=2 Tax=Gordonia soli TaxID=320799 RepID=M0QFG8_9ACTN|nr:ribokinase [Gordonia soli NBRC 108243]